MKYFLARPWCIDPRSTFCYTQKAEPSLLTKDLPRYSEGPWLVCSIHAGKIEIEEIWSRTYAIHA